MSKSQVDGVQLLIGVAAAVLALSLLTGPFAWLGSICGLLLLLTLLGYDREGYRTILESMAFSGVFALTVTVTFAVPLRVIAVSQGHQPTFEGVLGSEWLPLLWLGVTVIFVFIDRARMSGRVQYSGEATMLAVTPQRSQPAASLYTDSFRPPQPTAMPERVYAPPERAIPAEPVYAPNPVVPPNPVFAPTPLATATPVMAAVVPEAPAPVVQAAPIPSGPQVTIYVTLVGEGLNVLRGVLAEHVGRDFYKIVEPMPEGETWQYGPGQVVRCKKKNLSGGKALVAFEEAPRAR